jgi:hypothetical protein
MATDFYWTLDGDLSIGKDGDIRDTNFDVLRSTWQEIRTRVRSGYKEWALHPTLGANLHDLLGKINNRMTAEEGKANIIAALVQGGFLKKEAVKVRYMPLSRHRLMYSITVTVYVPEIGQTRMLKTQLLYDTLEGGVSVV